MSQCSYFSVGTTMPRMIRFWQSRKTVGGAGENQRPEGVEETDRRKRQQIKTCEDSHRSRNDDAAPRAVLRTAAKRGEQQHCRGADQSRNEQRVDRKSSQQQERRNH